MFFLTLCPVSDYDLFVDPVLGANDLLGFLSAAAFLAIPIGVFVFLWRNFVPNAPDPSSDVVEFRLEDPSICYEKADPPTWIVALYLVTGLATFSLGVLAFEVVHSFS